MQWSCITRLWLPWGKLWFDARFSAWKKRESPRKREQLSMGPLLLWGLSRCRHNHINHLHTGHLLSPLLTAFLGYCGHFFRQGSSTLWRNWRSDFAVRLTTYLPFEGRTKEIAAPSNPWNRGTLLSNLWWGTFVGYFMPRPCQLSPMLKHFASKKCIHVLHYGFYNRIGRQNDIALNLQFYSRADRWGWMMGKGKCIILLQCPDQRI